MLISRCSMSPTHVYWELVYGIKKWLWECLPHVAKWFPHTVQYGLIDTECMHLLNPCVVEKGETSREVTHIHGCVHCNTISVFGLWKELYYDIMRSIQQCFESHTLIWGVILWYSEVTPGVLMSHNKWLPRTMQHSPIDIEYFIH